MAAQSECVYGIMSVLFKELTFLLYKTATLSLREVFQMQSYYKKVKCGKI